MPFRIEHPGPLIAKEFALLEKTPMFVFLLLFPATQAESINDSLTFEKALEKVFQNHPGLEAGRSAVSARAAAADQAGRGPNPELGIEVEDVAGTGVYKGFNAAQTTAHISQTVEWSGKRDKRKQVAEVEMKLAQTELERKRLEMRSLAHARFMEALMAQRRLTLSQEAQGLAERLLEAVARRVMEGAASSADEIRSRLAVSEAELEVRQNILLLEAAKKKLALLMGGGKMGDGNTVISALRGDLETLRPLPSLDELIRILEQSPEAVWRAENVQLAEARLLQQQSLSRPDMTVSAGIRHAAAPGDVALVGGIFLPLPVRNRNQGGKEEARHEVARVKAEEKAVLLELKSALAEFHQELLLARNEIETLKEKLIPEAGRAAQIIEEGYRRGRYGMLDVLNAEADLFRHRSRYLDALLRYQQSYAHMERLIGTKEKGN